VTLTVLSVGYPLAPVSRDTAGGAEQVLATLDRALVANGHRSLVVAQEGSSVAGELLPVPKPVGVLDERATAVAQAATRAAIAEALARWPVDVVHLHGIDFHAYLPSPGVPALATLHLPPAWYPREALHPGRPDAWLVCVSEAQHRAAPPSSAMLRPIANGVDVEGLAAVHARRSFVLCLGRICPEKGVHLAIEAARRAGASLLIAGEVFEYGAHRRYFDEVVSPQLGPGCRFLGPVGFARKRRLLTAARAVLIPSLVEETSSLVSREAAACGTPVIAFPNGALTEAVEDGRTGFLVGDVPAMADAIGRVATISPEVCRKVAHERFSEENMVREYLALYERLASGQAARGRSA
jgi:glycosyltransferase involved in cell wall biosynthesis